MTNHPKTLEEALEMFDDLSDYHEVNGEDEFKELLTTVWHAGRESVVETVEGMRVKKCVKGHDNVAQCIMQECEINNHSYNSALTDVITKLSELKEKK